MRLVHLLIAASALVPAVAHAQSGQDIVVMRRSLAPPNDIRTPEQRKVEWKTGDWISPAACSSSVTETRTVDCRRDGALQPDASCLGPTTPKPATTRPGENYSTCTYSWKPGEWSDWNPTCSANAERTRTDTCIRSNDTTVDDTFCTGKTHNQLKENGGVYTSCATEWQYGTWVSASTCSKSTTQTRTATCMRTVNGVKSAVADSVCSGITKDDSRAGVVDNSTCTTAWGTPSAWSPTPPASTCTSKYDQTRTVSCEAKYDDNTTAVVGDARCTATKPITSQSPAVTTGCTYSPTYGAYAACSGGVKKQTMTSCTRSDNTVVATSFCTAAGYAATKSVSCYTCALTAGKTANFGSYVGNYAYSAAEAKTACEGRANNANKAGTCRWDGVSISDFQEGNVTVTNGTAKQYAGSCYVTP